MKTRVCLQCKANFIAEAHNQMFCLAKCRAKYYYHNRPETRHKRSLSSKRYKEAHPDAHRKWYTDFLERNPGYRQMKTREFFEKHPDYWKSYKRGVSTKEEL